MTAYLFVVSLAIAVLGPVLAVTYLRPILTNVLQRLCGGDSGAEFWIRCIYLLAICGTLLLVLTFGQFSEHSDVIQILRRTFMLVLAAVFLTVAMISRNVWREVRRMLGDPASPGTLDKAATHES